MIRLTIDGEHKGFYDDRDAAVDALLDRTDSSIDDVQLTPDRLTALADGPAFSDLSHDNQVEELRHFMDEEFPVEKIARNAVKAEMELHYRRNDVPADATPLESDRHDDAAQQWFGTHVNFEAFDGIDALDAVLEVKTETIEVVEGEIASLWREYPHTLDEIPQLDKSHADDLWEHGYPTPLDVLDADAEAIADDLGLGVGWAERLQDAVRGDGG